MKRFVLFMLLVGCVSANDFQPVLISASHPFDNVTVSVCSYQDYCGDVFNDTFVNPSPASSSMVAYVYANSTYDELYYFSALVSNSSGDELVDNATPGYLGRSVVVNNNLTVRFNFMGSGGVTNESDFGGFNAFSFAWGNQTFAQYGSFAVGGMLPMGGNTLDPNNDNNIGWDCWNYGGMCSGGSAYSTVGQSVYYPDIGVDYNKFIVARWNSQYEEFQFKGNPLVDSATNITVWVFGNITGSDSVKVGVCMGADCLSDKTLPLTETAGWASVSWDGYYTQGDYLGQVYIHYRKDGNDGNATIWATYEEVQNKTYSTTTAGGAYDVAIGVGAEADRDSTLMPFFGGLAVGNVVIGVGTKSTGLLNTAVGGTEALLGLGVSNEVTDSIESSSFGINKLNMTALSVVDGAANQVNDCIGCVVTGIMNTATGNDIGGGGGGLFGGGGIQFGMTEGIFNYVNTSMGIAIGFQNAVIAPNGGMAFGGSNFLSGNQSIAFGSSNDLSGASGFAIGTNNNITADGFGFAFGSGNYIGDGGGMSVGIYNIIHGTNGGAAIGGMNEISGDAFGYADGMYNNLSGGNVDDFNLAFGVGNIVSDGGVAFGYYLTNNINATLMVGANITNMVFDGNDNITINTGNISIDGYMGWSGDCYPPNGVRVDKGIVVDCIAPPS